MNAATFNMMGDLQFFDRGPLCTYALGKYLSYSKNIEFTPSPILLDEIERSSKTAFIRITYSSLKIWGLLLIQMLEK
jgi:hypothetical protein